MNVYYIERKDLMIVEVEGLGKGEGDKLSETIKEIGVERVLIIPGNFHFIKEAGGENE